MADQQTDAEVEEVEKVEGLGSSEDETLGEYPLDTMLIRNENRTIHDVLRRIGQGRFIMDPEFQRDFIWPVGQTEQADRIGLDAHPAPRLLHCRKR